MICTFDTEVEAVNFVRQAIEDEGSAYIERWFLGREDEDGETHLIASGSDLARLTAIPAG